MPNSSFAGARVPLKFPFNNGGKLAWTAPGDISW
jgi:hypothetical protein